MHGYIAKEKNDLNMDKQSDTLKNFIWRFAERASSQIVTLVVSIAIARVVAPEAYGTLALITVITSLLQLFVDCGLSTALIQKKNVDDLDYSSVFYFNMFLCVALYILTFILSPMIAYVYNDKSLVNIIRVAGILILVSGVKGVQQAYVARNALFKSFFFSTLGGTIISAIVGLIMAYSGYGVWALVMQILSNATFDTMILWFTVRWRPKKLFSWTRLKSLVSFGWKLLISSLLGSGYTSISNLVIGKVFSTTDLAYYTQGDKYPNIIVGNICMSVDSVILPVMSKEQDNKKKVRQITRKTLKMNTYILVPLMMGLAFCAEPIVGLLFTEKWLHCVPYLRMYCIIYMLWPMHNVNIDAINALGRSDMVLKFELIRNLVSVCMLLITSRVGVIYVAYGVLITSIFTQVLISSYNGKLIDYGFIDQLKDIGPSILLGTIMGVIVYFFKFLGFSSVVTVLLQVLVGGGVYIGTSCVLKLDEIYWLKRVIKIYLKDKI